MSKVEDESMHHEVASMQSDDVDLSAIGGRDTSELPAHYFRSFKFIGTVLAMGIGASTSTAFYPMIAVGFSFMNKDLGPSQDAVWIILSFTLCQSMVFPILGRLGDLFGRRWLFLGSYFLCFIGFLISGRAKTMGTLIAGNSIAGAGSAALTAGVAISGELVPNKHRFALFAIVSVTLGPLIAIAPGLGRIFCVNTAHGWRWIFDLCAILTFVAFVLIAFCYFPPDFHSLHKRETKTDIIKSFDYVGMVLYSGSSSALLLGVSWGGQRYAWKSSEVIASIVVGALGMVALILWEHFAKPAHPFFALSLLTNRNWALLSICSCMASMIFYALNILWVQQLAILYQFSPVTAGWAACTLTAGVVAGWFCSAPVIATFKALSIKYQLIACAVVLTAFTGGEAAANDSHIALGIVFSVFGSFSIGWLENICIVGAPLHVDAKNLGIASGLQMSLRVVMSSLASAIFVTILSNEVAKNVPGRIMATASEAGLSTESAALLVQGIVTGNETTISNIPGISPGIIESASAAARQGYFKSFQVVYYARLAFGIVTIIAACSVSNTVMQSKLTPEVARRLRKVENRPSATPREDSDDPRVEK